ncbi:hypothetical protein GMRT_10943 [Giardia muris]|uniref:Uncharacterized protein n=1 Tax=Giardia muris TaxID=5742 RepID=A0A4Z1SXL0_GIAMU|nr:hypothetical protein GMRT_10943 [Giardia muris]|eukprot:TNJ30436.1 hypothetical protein GMRT_10943 [Giardia muris]
MSAYQILAQSNLSADRFDARSFLSDFLLANPGTEAQIVPAIQRLRAEADYLQGQSLGNNVSLVVTASRVAETLTSSLARLTGLVHNLGMEQAQIRKHLMVYSQAFDMSSNEQPEEVDETQEEEEDSKSIVEEPKWPQAIYSLLDHEVRLSLSENRLTQAYIQLQLAGMLTLSRVSQLESKSIIGPPTGALLEASYNELLSRGFILPSRTEVFRVAILEASVKQAFLLQASQFLFTDRVTSLEAYKENLLHRRVRAFDTTVKDTINSYHIDVLNEYANLCRETTESMSLSEAPGSSSTPIFGSRETAREKLQHIILRMTHYLDAGEDLLRVYLPLELVDVARHARRDQTVGGSGFTRRVYEENYLANLALFTRSLKRALDFAKLFAPCTDEHTIARLRTRIHLWTQEFVEKLCATLLSEYATFLRVFTPRLLGQVFTSLNLIFSQSLALLSTEACMGLGLGSLFRQTMSQMIILALKAANDCYIVSDAPVCATYKVTLEERSFGGQPFSVFRFSALGDEDTSRMNSGFLYIDGYWHDRRINKRCTANISRVADVQTSLRITLPLLQSPYLETLLCMERPEQYHDLLAELLAASIQGRNKENASSDQSISIIQNMDVGIPHAELNRLLGPFARKVLPEALQAVTMVAFALPSLEISERVLQFITGIATTYTDLVDFNSLVPQIRTTFTQIIVKLLMAMVDQFESIPERIRMAEGSGITAATELHRLQEYKYALVSTICFFVAAVMPISTASLRAALIAYQDITIIGDYFIVVRDLYMAGTSALRSLFKSIAVETVPELIKCCWLRESPGLDMLRVLQTTALNYGSTMPYNAFCLLTNRIIEQFLQEVEPARCQDKLIAEILGLLGALQSSHLEGICRARFGKPSLPAANPQPFLHMLETIPVPVLQVV